MENPGEPAIHREDPTQEKRKNPFTRMRILTAIIVAALFFVGFLQMVTGARGSVTTEINDQLLGVSGTYGSPVFLELDSITEVQLVDSFNFGECVEGEETGNTVSGTYFCEEYGNYTAHAYTRGACIVIHSPDGVLVFNCGSDSNTKDLYAKLVEAAGQA